MKQKDLVTLIIIAFITAIFSFVLSSVLFKIPVGRATKVASAASSVSTNFPDIKNDPNYNTIFNTNSLDPAVPVQVGTNPNSQPFNESSQ